MSEYTNDWFDTNSKQVWDVLIPNIKPQRILEIGSYEGRSICYLIEKLGNDSDLEIHAIDTWEGGSDHMSKQIAHATPFKGIEERFYKNVKESMDKVVTKTNLQIHKGSSDIELARLLSTGFSEYFDFIYVDGSHETTDVLSDAVLSFKLLKKGGMMILDDYLWCVDGHSLYRPKLAIDAFVNINYSKLSVLNAPNSQVYVVKKS
jgi:predicted O-methyltransferase YrrM